MTFLASSVGQSSFLRFLSVGVPFSVVGFFLLSIEFEGLYVDCNNSWGNRGNLLCDRDGGPISRGMKLAGGFAPSNFIS